MTANLRNITKPLLHPGIYTTRNMKMFHIEIKAKGAVDESGEMVVDRKLSWRLNVLFCDVRLLAGSIVSLK